MRVKTVDCTDADVRSASVFFKAVAGIYDLSKVRALDMFARNGQLTISNYRHFVRSFHAWELGPEHEVDLLRLGADEVHIGCSYQQAALCLHRYDMIVIDTPQGLHKDAGGAVHAEHFDALPIAAGLLNERGFLVLYVNKAPYNRDEVGSHGYDEYEEYDFEVWMQRRALFYHSVRSEITEDIALFAYRELLASEGYKVLSTVSVPCLSDVPGREAYSYRLGLEVERI